MKKQNIKPPIFADKLFEWYCGNAPIEDLRGDMEELFYTNLGKMSVAKAKVKYWQLALSLIFSYLLTTEVARLLQAYLIFYRQNDREKRALKQILQVYVQPCARLQRQE